MFTQFWNSGKPSWAFRRLQADEDQDYAIGDSALDPQVAATVAGQMLSNKKVLAMSGFVGSNENLGGGPILDRGILRLSSRPEIPRENLNNFYRVVPNNLAQAQLAVGYLLKAA